ncbi:MAG: phosphoribosyltransferase family protein [Ferruginibacter sp.]
MAERTLILSPETARRKLKRMAMEIAERNSGCAEILLVGVKENGVIIARLMQQMLKDIFLGKVVVSEVTLNKKQPTSVSLSVAINVTDKVIILVDDVANTGKTMLYALQPLLQFAPDRIQTLALVERTHKLFPIAIDYIGFSISTTLQQNIEVEIDKGEIVGAWLR